PLVPRWFTPGNLFHLLCWRRSFRSMGMSSPLQTRSQTSVETNGRLVLLLRSYGGGGGRGFPFFCFADLVLPNTQIPRVLPTPLLQSGAVTQTLRGSFEHLKTKSYAKPLTSWWFPTTAFQQLLVDQMLCSF